ncbi:Biopolymer transport protein ExbD [Roseivivax sp. THAF40]|uniref:ExbD/TolR family protein n=1 Tax=unclassified Roseivivax TaxID=2639302 RepID=UPI001267ADFD|nr:MULTISPECIES: biopolymer transporter ExbD [unclassified Roseivivax]QFS83639.1 Biopolymer transport protein ExbD [Roseivivax sp. THAF197b]QFT47447.1 Biopolymer transport protein ExbD [Roseivivax sp. THAF40]
MSLGLRSRAARRRKPSLTPMIDVVFLLLVFFMLAARFGTSSALALAPGGGDAEAAYSGPPRLIEVGADEALWLNDTAQPGPDALLTALADLTDGPDDIVVLRGRDGAETGDLVAIIALLNRAGYQRLAVVE